MKILIVDDDLFNVNALKSIINLKYNLEVTEAYNGQQGIDKVIEKFDSAINKESKCCSFFSIIIMDVDMPVIIQFNVYYFKITFLLEICCRQFEIPKKKINQKKKNNGLEFYYKNNGNRK